MTQTRSMGIFGVVSGALIPTIAIAADVPRDSQVVFPLPKAPNILFVLTDDQLHNLT